MACLVPCPAGQKWRPFRSSLTGGELRALRQLHVTAAGAAYLFVSERGGPLTARTVHHIVAVAGEAANLPFPVHPHMLRHACGFYLANKGVDTRALQQYLGPRNIQHTVRYTDLLHSAFRISGTIDRHAQETVLPDYSGEATRKEHAKAEVAPYDSFSILRPSWPKLLLGLCQTLWTWFAPFCVLSYSMRSVGPCTR